MFQENSAVITQEQAMNESPTGNRIEEQRPHGPDTDQAIDHIRQALRGLRFGEVSVIVQDGVVIQVERTERKRLRRGER